MKKLLSVVLALAMVLGCLSMVTFAGEEENVAVKIVSNGTTWQCLFTGSGFWTNAAATGTETKTVTLTFYNPNNYGVKIRFEMLSGWNLVGAREDFNIPTQSKKEITITRTFTNGKCEGYTASSMRFRMYIIDSTVSISTTTGDAFYLQDSRKAEATYLSADLGNANAKYQEAVAVTAAEMPQMPTGMRIDITETASANFYNNTLGLTTDDITEIDGNKYFVFKYRVFNLSDTASIIRFSVWANWNGMSGGAVSTIGAHAYADYELKVPVNSDNTISSNNSAISTLRLGFLTDDGSFTAGERFVIQALNDLATTFFVPKVQGGPSGSLFNPTLLTGNAASYDEYKLTGMYLNVAQDAGAWNYVRNATLNLDTSFISTDESGNRWLIFSYRIYNLSNQAATFGFFAQGGSNGWGTISGAADSGSKVIDGQTYADYEVKIPVNADNTLGTDSGTTLAKVSLRMENKTAISAGQQFVIRALNKNATVFFNGNVYSSKINNDTDAVYTAGDLVFGVSHYDTLPNTPTSTPTPAPTPTPTPTPEVTPTPTPSYVAVKVENNGTKPARFMTKTGIWANGVKGEQTVTFVIYNPSEYDVKISCAIQGTHNGWSDVSSGEAGTRTLYVNAKSKLTITRSVVFDENGKAPITAGGSTGYYYPSSLFARFEISELPQGAYIYIQDTRTSGIDYFYIDDAADGTITKATSIPTFDEVKAMKITFDNDFSDSLYNRTEISSDISINDVQEVNGERFVLRQYAVYNYSNHHINLSINYQATHKWTDIAGITYPNGINDESSIWVEPYGRCVYAIKIPVTSDNTVLLADESYATLGSLFARIDLDASTVADGKTFAMSQGDSIVIQPLSGSGDIMFTLLDNANYTTTTINASESLSKIIGSSLSIGSSFTYNLLALPEYGKNAEFKVTRTGSLNNEVKTDNEPDMWGKLEIAYAVNAQCMADPITIELNIDGVNEKTISDYSIRQYAMNLYTSGANSTLDNLLRDMLIYGAEAQKEIEYNVTDLATAGTFADNYTISTVNKDAVSEQSVKTITGSAIKSAGLNISYVNKIYFRLADATKVTSVTINDVAATIKGGVVYTEAIKATEFAKIYTIVVTTSDGETSTVSYNVSAYLAAKWDSANVGDIVKALANYGCSANAYANA